MSDVLLHFETANELADEGDWEGFVTSLFLIFRTFRPSNSEPINIAQLQAAGKALRRLEQWLRTSPEWSHLQEPLPKILGDVRAAMDDWISSGEGEMEFRKLAAGAFSDWLERLMQAVEPLYAGRQRAALPWLRLETDPDLHHVGLYALVSTEHLSSGQAAELRSRIDDKAEHPELLPENRLFNAACSMLLSGMFAESISAFLQVLRRLPDYAAQCYNNIGAAHFFLRQYEPAIDAYRLAWQAGANAQRIEYNIWEACQQLALSVPDRNEQMRWQFFFKELFPNSEMNFG